MDSIIEASGIRKSFGDLQVLKGVDLSIARGEIVSVTGPSGAGKSTLLEVLGTLLPADEGTIVINGTDIGKGSPLRGDALAEFRNRSIGFVFQDSNLLAEFSALENVTLPLLISGMKLSTAKDKAKCLLEKVGLGGRLSHKPSELSGGERQRVAIARAIACSPAIVLADEPTGNLDSATKEEIRQLFFSLRDSEGQTFLIVTHDPDLAAHCDRTLTLIDGQFVQDTIPAASAA